MYRPHSPLMHSYGWLLVWVLLGVASGFSDALVDAIGPWVTALVFVQVGLALGLLWYRLYPRPFGERMRAIGRLVAIFFAMGMAILAVVALFGLITVLAGGDWSDVGVTVDGFAWPDPAKAAYLGVVAGLFLAGRRDPNAPFALNSVRSDVRAGSGGTEDASTSLAGTGTALRPDRLADGDGDS
jgi:hypothetical protein